MWRTPVVTRLANTPSNVPAMAPNQKRSGFTRSRECNVHPMTMPKAPDGMPTMLNDCEEEAANAAGLGASTPLRNGRSSG